MKSVFRVRYERGAAGTMLITADNFEDAERKMKAYFKRTPNYNQCTLLCVEYLGPLWDDI